MTLAQAAPAGVRLRTPRRDWVPLFVAGVSQLVLATWWWLLPDPVDLRVWLPVSQLAFGTLLTAEGLLLSTFSIDLTPDAAIVRGLRRRVIVWSDLQGVVSRQRLGSTWVVQLVPAQGRPITLRAATSWGGFGVTTHVQQFHQIGQWWLAHSGPTWRPKAPGPYGPG